MFKFFYAKMAFQNIRKNRRFYLPFMLAVIFTVAMFYNMYAIARDDALADMPGADMISIIMLFGVIIVGIFSVIFLCYTNSFLMKRRQKELALYNILGMEKRHIAKMLVWESVFSGVISIAGGIAAGILCSKFLLLILFRALFFEVHFGLTVQMSWIEGTAIFFACVFVVNLIVNLIRIRMCNPVELMAAESGGEKEPKANVILVIAGIVTLGLGYAISLKNNVLSSDIITDFFIAVILVIIGTYCLFTAISILILKALRRNKNFYYKPNHFTLVSGMLYRMKQNAVGLANICILSTMVLVLLSTTICLFAGFDDFLNVRYPNEFSVSMHINDHEETTEVKELIQSECGKNGFVLTNETEHEIVTAFMKKDGSSFEYLTENDAEEEYEEGNEIVLLHITTKDYYEVKAKDKVDLSDDEVLLYAYGSGAGDLPQTVEINQKEYSVKKQLDEFMVEGGAFIVSPDLDTYYVIVSSTEELEKINRELDNGTSHLSWYYGVDYKADQEAGMAFYEHMMEKGAEFKELKMNSGGAQASVYDSIYFISKAERAINMYSLYGGFLFLGIFLGIVFLMATILIMYYKQISEGYEDQRRFEIMQKVGMGKAEVRRTIRYQVLTVFFLPLIIAVLHLCMAFPMVKSMISMFGINDIKLFLICILITVAVFAVVYCIVYMLTARVYYRIVSAG